jgi:hypothetical protein
LSVSSIPLPEFYKALAMFFVSDFFSNLARVRMAVVDGGEYEESQ